MNHYEQKQEARRERILARADRMHTEGQRRYDSGFERLRAIPFGQPILIGHHSEKRDRNYRRKAVGSIDKGCELMKAADEAEARAEAYSSEPVASRRIRSECLDVVETPAPAAPLLSCCRAMRILARLDADSARRCD